MRTIARLVLVAMLLGPVGLALGEEQSEKADQGKSKKEIYAEIYYVGDLIETQPKADFKPLVELIKTVVAPGTWEWVGRGIVEYSPNQSLIIRQTEEVHAETTDLLTQLRKLNGIQIEVRCELIAIDEKLLASGGEIKPDRTPRLAMLNGQSATVEYGVAKTRLVRIEPVSGKPVDPKLAAKNEPITLVVPAGKGISVQGVAGTDQMTITLSVNIEGDEKTYTRIFHASPILLEEEEKALTGTPEPIVMGGVTPRIIIQEEEEEFLTGMRTDGP